jgi:hypothetical protein
VKQQQKIRHVMNMRKHMILFKKKGSFDKEGIVAL